MSQATATSWSAVARAVQASLLSESLADFAKAAWPVLEPQTTLRWGWALDAICEHLEAVTAGHLTRLLMNVPPGCMKSLLTGVLWPAWEWTRPGLRSMRYLGTAHKEPLATRDNLKCRRLIQSAWYQARWPLRLVSDQNAKTKFENEATGFRESMAFTGMTGSRGDRIIVDDPLSVDGAQSEADLASADRTFTESLPTRVNNETSAIVIIMQRLHELDTSGLIISRDLGYCHLMLPMRFEPKRRCTTSIGFSDPRTKDQELLFPERFPEKDVKELERTLGEYATAGQLQQSPTPRGGGTFKAAHLQLYAKDRKLPPFHFIIQSYDTAYTDKTVNDPCACTTWGVWKDKKDHANVLLLDAWDDHLNYAKLRKKVVGDWRLKYGVRDDDPTNVGRRADACLVEVKGSGISLIQELRTANVPAQSYNPGRADKHARAQRVLPLYELGLVWILESEAEPGEYISWAKPFTKELTKFGPTTAAHDDYVDTLTQALIYLKDAGWLVIPDIKDDEVEEAPYGGKRRNPYD